jgi:hypothetical protein
MSQRIMFIQDGALKSIELSLTQFQYFNHRRKVNRSFKEVFEFVTKGEVDYDKISGVYVMQISIKDNEVTYHNIETNKITITTEHQAF